MCDGFLFMLYTFIKNAGCLQMKIDLKCCDDGDLSATVDAYIEWSLLWASIE